MYKPKSAEGDQIMFRCATCHRTKLDRSHKDYCTGVSNPDKYYRDSQVTGTTFEYGEQVVRFTHLNRNGDRVRESGRAFCFMKRQ